VVARVEQHQAIGQRLDRAAHVCEGIGQPLLALCRVALEAVQGAEHLVPDPFAFRHLSG
jgi:hypothetical protein